jgi:hypothetical protein
MTTNCKKSFARGHFICMRSLLKANLSRKRKAASGKFAADGFLSMTFDKFNTLKKEVGEA